MLGPWSTKTSDPFHIHYFQTRFHLCIWFLLPKCITSLSLSPRPNWNTFSSGIKFSNLFRFSYILILSLGILATPSSLESFSNLMNIPSMHSFKWFIRMNKTLCHPSHHFSPGCRGTIGEQSLCMTCQSATNPPTQHHPPIFSSLATRILWETLSKSLL